MSHVNAALTPRARLRLTRQGCEVLDGGAHDMKNRGVNDSFFVVCDGLKGLPEVVSNVRAARDEASEAVWFEVIKRFPDMRFWVAQHKSVPLSVLEVLRHDDDQQVRDMVRANGVWKRVHPDDTKRLSDPETAYSRMRSHSRAAGHAVHADGAGPFMPMVHQHTHRRAIERSRVTSSGSLPVDDQGPNRRNREAPAGGDLSVPRGDLSASGQRERARAKKFPTGRISRGDLFMPVSTGLRPYRAPAAGGATRDKVCALVFGD